MTTLIGKTYDEERALYGMEGVTVKRCRFDGPADGESALKECRRVRAEECFFNLRYPFWHDTDLEIEGCEMTPLCRAALWYSRNVCIRDSKLRGIKALRECERVEMEDCAIVSPEFGWSVRGMEMRRCDAESEYFMLRAEDLRFEDVKLRGKYSFQYLRNGRFDRCVFDTKDAFWHAENVVIRDSVIRGEYLAWYCKNVTFDHCEIRGTQPFCYCEGLKLLDCRMIGTDLAFEKSSVEAEILTPVDSVKNPRSGRIVVPAVGELILDDPLARGEVIVSGPARSEAKGEGSL